MKSYERKSSTRDCDLEQSTESTWKMRMFSVADGSVRQNTPGW